MTLILWVIAGLATGIVLSVLAVAALIVWAARHWRG